MKIEVEVDESLMAYLRGRMRSSKLNAKVLRTRAKEQIARAKAIRAIGAEQIAQDLDQEVSRLIADAEEIEAEAQQQRELLGQLHVGQRLAVRII